MSRFFPTPEVIELSDWICHQGLLRPDLGDLLDGFCQRLAKTGISLLRGHYSLQTLHPRITGLGYVWRPDIGVASDTYLYRTEPSEAFLQSPIKHVLDNSLDELRVKLEGDAVLPYPICDEFRAEGGSDYFMQLQGFGRDGIADGRTGVIFSWTSSAQGGFTDNQIEVLRFLAPRLAMAVQTRTSQDITINLLDAYVGKAAGKKILSGEIRRGALDVISSVILLADLQGFTAMAERADRDDLLEMLNQYFDCIVGPIFDRGGNVLKFLGDGLLATFPLNDKPADVLCEHALDAASEILHLVDAINPQRTAAGKLVMDMDIALHLGDVYWGNVGSEERLDFTIIGPAVNEVSRIEALCAQFERKLLVSETFAQAATRSADRLVSIGRFALRGVRSAQSIYTLEDLLGREEPDHKIRV